MTRSRRQLLAVPEAAPAAKDPRESISQKTVERLVLYRRILMQAAAEKKLTLFSHDIAAISGATPAQVRRDLMAVGYLGHPLRGYEIEGLLEKLDAFLDVSRGARLALVGVGNLGRALLAYFSAGRSQLAIEAAFDVEPSRVNRTINGCRVYPIEQLAAVVKKSRIEVAVIAVPAQAAQEVAEKLVAAGIKSIVNTAPVRLKVPRSIFVEDLDISISIEKAAFYAQSRPEEDE